MFDASRISIRILLVDDHKSFMDGLSMLLDSQKPKMEVIGMASNKDEAIESAINLKPDVILMDMDLGDALSLEFIPEIVEKTDSKILVLTGMRDPDIHDSAIMKGARGVVLKGEPGKIIIKAIEKVNEGEIWASNTMFSRVFSQMKGSIQKKESDTDGQKIADLTPREREIIASLFRFEDSTNKEIAGSLCISESTLKNHLTTIFSKLEVKNRLQLMKFALKHNLAKTPE